MRLTLSPEQNDLRDTTRRFLVSQSSLDYVRERLEKDTPRYDRSLWRRACIELGLGGLVAAPERGGSGTGLAEASLALEEFGAVLEGSPLLSVTAAVSALEMVGEDLAERYVSRLVDGDLVGVVVFDLLNEETSLVLEPGEGGSCAVSGTIDNVMDGPEADLFILVTSAGSECRLAVVEAQATGVRIDTTASLDLTRRFAQLQLDQAAGTCVAISESVACGIEDRMAVMIAAELNGLSRACLMNTTAYLNDRVAFGRIVGSYQGIKHQLAEMYCDLELVQSAVRAAASGADEHLATASLDALVALRAASFIAVETATECLRLHGGIGYTWEHDAHLYLRRAHQLQSLLGGREHTDVRLLGHILAPGAAS